MRILLLFRLATNLLAADAREPDLLKAQQAFTRCWDLGDAKCIEPWITNNYVNTSRSGRVTERAAFLSNLASGGFSKADATKLFQWPDSAKIYFYGDTAIAVYSSRGPMAPRGRETEGRTVTNHITRVWIYSAGVWKAASNHVTIEETQ